MKTNVATPKPKLYTHEGGKAERQNARQELLRAVSTCMLFEDTFYEGGDSIANRIAELCASNPPETVAAIAVHARENLKLRHVPLWLLVQMLDNPRTDSVLFVNACVAVVRRPDEMGELLALFTKDRKGLKKLNRLPNKLKDGLAAVLPKFGAYQLAKWNRKSDIRLRDIVRLVHPKPTSPEQAALWKSILDDTLPTPNTWETRLSAGEDKKAVFEDLLRTKQLGYMALLMNLRNMQEAGVHRELVREAVMSGAKGSVALPFRFVSAARHAPSFSDILSDGMIAALEDYPKLKGLTYIIVDNSGSMTSPISQRSEVSRATTAAALAILLREVCDDVRVFSFGSTCAEVGNVRGLPLIREMASQNVGHGTNTGYAVNYAYEKGIPDRVIVITDEQAHDQITKVAAKYGSYIVNVAPYAPGLDVSNKGWVRINGWSERLVEWIQMLEAENA
jgi:60 kDa SS-A/Ro ribonucleoprotein